jgi:hypothetical protein
MRPLALSLIAVVTAMSCGSPEQEAVEQTQHFLVWNPGALLTEHTQWHQGACGTAGARKCPRSGEDFLVFHRNFLDRLRDEFTRQGLTADITPWVTIPAAMKNTANGWSTTLQDAENAINSMINPATGARFASLEVFGAYVEDRIHGSLHGIAQRTYGEAEIGPVNMSPKSTYFFKIHGWVERQFMRYQRGDFNKDGNSDLFVRNNSTGVNQIWFMNGSAVSSKVNTSPVGIDGCNWYVGATADLNYDGFVDLIWHSRECNMVSAWFMNGTTLVSGPVIANVGTGWTLIGSGDFTADARPDLIWRNDSTWDVVIWKMNGTAIETSYAVDIADFHVPVLVGDVTDNGVADIILRKAGTIPENLHFVQHMAANGVKSSLLQVTGLTKSIYATPSAIGRFQQRSNTSDVVFRNQPPGPFADYALGLQTVIAGSPTYAMTGGVATSVNEIIQGPR